MSLPSNALARRFKDLHVPKHPLVLANVWDISSARTVAALPECKALATASYAVAISRGTVDAQLTLDQNLATVASIAKVAKEFDKPLSVDLQDGYDDSLDEAIKKLIEFGVVGINIEDSNRVDDSMMSCEKAESRIKRVLSVAADLGVPDFVVNARSDSFLRKRDLDEAIRRGKRYLEAGATSVYVLGNPSPTSAEIGKLVAAFDGRLNIGLSLQPGMLSTSDLGEMGLSRISVGPQIHVVAMNAIKAAAERILT
jgi:2-methylisocitrate lyase-like PEP mutase family enzyme